MQAFECLICISNINIWQRLKCKITGNKMCLHMGTGNNIDMLCTCINNAQRCHQLLFTTGMWCVSYEKCSAKQTSKEQQGTSLFLKLLSLRQPCSCTQIPMSQCDSDCKLWHVAIIWRKQSVFKHGGLHMIHKSTRPSEACIMHISLKGLCAYVTWSESCWTMGTS